MTTLSIPDMSCGHCSASVQQALTALPGAAAISVDLAARTATVTGPADPATLLAALNRIGFPAQVVG